VRGGLTFKFDKNSTNLWCFLFQFGGLGALFGGPNPPNLSRGDGTASNHVKQKSWLKVSVEGLPYNTCKCFYILMPMGKDIFPLETTSSCRKLA